MLRIIVMVMAMIVLGLADGSVLQTGQVKSYNADGDVVVYGSVKDDGYYRAGVVRSYSRSGEVVTDNATGLEWQDNDTIQTTTICSDLQLDGGGWRLPTIEELETLVDKGRYIPSTTEGIFHYIISSDYRSSTIYAGCTSIKWIIDFYNGFSRFDNTAVATYVRCVRGGQLTPSSLSRNDATEIITDSTTALQWQDDEIVKITLRNWTSAIDYCENTLALGGHNDWRLPNQKELLSISDRSRYNQAIDMAVFINTATSSYWSSTTVAYSTIHAWIVNFSSGNPYYYYKSTGRFVRCVRDGQLSHSVNPSIIMYLLN